MLLLHHLLLVVRVRELLVDLVQLGLQRAHLGGRSVRLIGQREDHGLDDEGHQEDDQAEAGDEAMEEVEHRDDRVAGEPAHEPAAQRDDLLELMPDGLEGPEMVRTEVELERNAPVAARGQVGAHLRAAGH